MKHFAVFAAVSAALPYVAAHGFVSQVVIDGQTYEGNVPNQYKGPSPIRLISDISPVKGASNKDLFCGLNAALAEMVVPANPGSNVTFQWSGGGGQKWPHNTGPLMTYMASCGSTSCDKFDSLDAEWFKIDEAGKKNADTWVQQDIMNGDSYTLTLPSNLSPGGYLIRHEIIALHLAVTMGGAEFYPSCTQIQVGGNGNGQPNQTVHFPGAYSDSDPGIFDPTVFDSGSTYVFPGPSISNLASTQEEVTPPVSSVPFPSGTAVQTGKASSTSSTKVSAPSASASGSASNNASTGSKSQCKLKKRAASNSAEDLVVVRPRHFSRVMARLLRHSS
uniref:lytic cellulose monooxygenase (C4-dehydrogenating) n=1 Tax=Ganoderma boninense TaxID=34458 RepID=A0A5K1JVZ4_9APHY|nr:Cytochrome P450 monooxygenase AKT7 (EC (AK-toxin biosynthesis protein 7) [Ganoderma boninense]